jgi:hypothetical protein
MSEYNVTKFYRMYIIPIMLKQYQPETNSVGSWEAALLKRAAFQGR